VTDDSYDAWFNQIRTIDEIFAVNGTPLKDIGLQGIIDNIISTPEYNKSILQGYLSGGNKPKMMYKSVDTLDSYCTAVSLLIFFCVYLNCENWPKYRTYLKPLLGGILIPMMMFKIKDRMPIDVAIARIDVLIGAIKAAAAAKEAEAEAAEAAAGFITPKTRNSRIPLEIPRTPVKQSRANFLKSIGRAPAGERSYRKRKREPSVAGGTRKKLKSVRRTKRGRRRA